jgi:hypothetical protein
MSDHRSGLRWGFDIQTMGCKVMGSRFSADVLRIVIDDAEAFGPFVAIVAPWAGWSELEVIAAAAPLRLLGGLHDIVLRGKDTALATQYPPAEPAVWRGARSWSRSPAPTQPISQDSFNPRHRPTRCADRCAW